MKTLLRDLFSITFLVFCSTLSFAQSLIANVQPNTSCAAPNGTASASVDGETLDYSFKWYEGPDETGSLLSTQPVATNLAGGTYTVTATHNTTAAVLGPLSVNVPDDLVLPVVAVEVLSPLTQCGISDGALKAMVSGAADDYTYAWYQGTVPGGGLPVLAETQILSNRYNVTYTVVVTHKVSGCQSVASGTVPDERIIPTGVSVATLSSHTSCVTPNGSLKAVVPEPESDYSFTWFTGPQAALPIVSNSQTANNLYTGYYTVRVRHNVSHCPVDVTGFVPSNAIGPQVSMSISNLTSCASLNGSLTAGVPGSTVDYTFAWYQGTTLSGPVLSVNPTLSQLAAGTYSVVVRHNVSQCETIRSATVQDKRPVFSASVQVLSPSTSCSFPNGALTAVPSTGSSSSYTYKWYRGTAIVGTPLSTSQTCSQLSGGAYTVVLTHKTSQCVAIVSGTVPDNTVMGGISVEVVAPATSCTGPDGALGVVTQRPASEYSYLWFVGEGTNGPVYSTSQVFEPLFPGPYTVRVTHQATLCYVVITTVLPDESVAPQVSVSVQSSQTSCTSPNGSLTAAVAQGQPSDYLYYWFEGTSTFGPVLSTDPTIDQLTAGTYTVVVTGFISGCQTIISAVVPDETTSPVVSVELLSNATICASSFPVPANGSLRAVTAQGYPWDYTFTWYAGAAPGGPEITMGPVLNAVPAGVHTVVATHTASGCQAIASGIVQEEMVFFNGTIEVLSNNTSCSGTPNGTLKAVVFGGSVSDYTYEWYEGYVPYAGPVLSMGDELQGLSAGTYMVVITHQLTHCQERVSQNIQDECQQNLFSARSGDATSPETEQQLSYYPNPTTGTLWIKGESAAGYVVLSDRNGNVIRRQNLSPSGDAFAVDLSDQPAGVYVLTFHSGVRTSSHQIMKK